MYMVTPNSLIIQFKTLCAVLQKDSAWNHVQQFKQFVACQKRRLNGSNYFKTLKKGGIKTIAMECWLKLYF